MSERSQSEALGIAADTKRCRALILGGYLLAELDAFATGARRNDINQQMREVARALTPAEREALADWYSGQHH